MLKLILPAFEGFDERSNLFVQQKAESLVLEHSLVSVAKWESKWNKPFLAQEQLTYEETISYVECMTLSKNVDPATYGRLTNEDMQKIEQYIEAPMTATKISESNKKGSKREIITAELIYYWMTALNIPFECQKWHLNRLLTLIQVCSIKSQPSKKMGRRDIASQNRSLNAARRAKRHSRG